jgi:hypothetical protein
MDLASSHCRFCGKDEPHGHSEEEQYIERYVRPAFEKLFIRMWPGNQSWSLQPHFSRIGEGWGRAPTPASDGVVPYPHYFGWCGMERAKNFGGSHAYSDHHWAYRAYFGGNYQQSAVQLFWQFFLASWEDLRLLPQFEGYGQRHVKFVKTPEYVADIKRQDRELEQEGFGRPCVILGTPYLNVSEASHRIGISVLQLLERINDPTLREYRYA